MRKHHAASSPPQPGRRAENHLSIRLLQAADVVYSRVFHQVIVRAPSRVPTSGAGIVVANHINFLDPILIQSVCPRLITWMMAKEYYDSKSIGWIFRAIGAIPVERSGRDMAATRSALRALEAGRVVGIFPEGKIETTRELLPFQTGVAMLALRAGVPIYPAYIEGSQRGKSLAQAYLSRQRAVVLFGPPIHLDTSDKSRDAMGVATDRIRAAVESLRAAAGSWPPPDR